MVMPDSTTEEEHLAIKFRLHDGSDIGPNRYPAATTVASLKQSLFAEWPQGMENVPKTANDLKLINAGMVLDNNKTLKECRNPHLEFSGVTTMHIVVRPAPSENKTEKKRAKKFKEPKCNCAIL